MEHPSLEDYFRTLPQLSNFRYSPQVANALVNKLFQSLAANDTDYLHYLFPSLPSSNAGSQRWSLREAQGAIEGAEYTEAARGQTCGHIFRPGEATYQCRTCGSDDTCVMCARCFEASDHEGHPIYIVMSGGHAGCCDCGDLEAWNRPMHCSIHSVDPSDAGHVEKGKAAASLPPQLVDSIKKTIARAMDYLVDVWSCSPEQLRLPKTEESVFDDVRFSRLSDEVYGGSDPASPENGKIEYALVLWNDEKHTIDDVQEIVARACKRTAAEGRQRADEIDAVGRAVIAYSTELDVLLKAATVLEQPNLSVSIRASRDIFREHMCATIVEWMIDISGCTVGPDSKILRTTICEELLSPWRIGSEAHHKFVGENGLYDHDREDIAKDLKQNLGPYGIGLLDRLQRAWGPTSRSSDDEDVETDEEDIDMDVDGSFQYEYEAPEDYLEAQEATLAGYPPPPPPPPARRSRTLRKRTMSEGGEGSDGLMAVPRTPQQTDRRGLKSPSYWTEKPAQFTRKKNLRPAEDLWQRVRLDYLILYDLRMWKQLRINLREVFVSTVITLPEYKRLLALRFASMYTVLAELHLIADREPEHSVLFLSLQIITTPSITAEIVEKGNFLTNLMAIIYTFLTTRQVGYPTEVDLSATLAIDQGVVFNRRATSFYHDMKYLFNLDIVKERIKKEPRYLLQFLDIAKIHQGICPNVRAIEEHVEYEMETWLSLSNVMSEVMRLCRLFAESFSIRSMDDQEHLQRALRTAAGVTIINSLGGEKKRFAQSEIKNSVRFKDLYPSEFSGEEKSKAGDRVLPQIVTYQVDSEPISCYHPMHYLLSWLIAECRGYPVDHVRSLLHFTGNELNELQSPKSTHHLPYAHSPEENLLSLFDFPIRVCVWMAQIRSGMWVRNGISLRHQLQQYKSVSRRELTFQRDIFMVQSAFVLCDPGMILSTIIDRFDLNQWFEGSFLAHKSREEHQTIDVAEELIHLIVAVLSDRLNIIPGSKAEILTKTVRREIIHALCFKTLSYTELKKLLTEGVRDADDQGILHELAAFKGPEGVSDHGVFSLREEYLEYVDPYLLNLTGNQREEAESLYRKYMAKKTGKDVAEIIYEPKIEPIESGVFKDLSAVINTPVFAQMVFYFIQYTMLAPSIAPEVPSTKVDQFFQFLLHLTLVAVMLDEPDEHPADSFCRTVFTKEARIAVALNTIVGLLHRSMEMEHLRSCAPKVKNILEHLRRKVPTEYGSWLSTLKTTGDAQEESSQSTQAADRELKKKQALARQARVMAQLKAQQDTFLQNQSVDWGDDTSDADPEAMEGVEHESTAKFPCGPCILCQEETDNGKLYGSFAFISRSRVFRQTPPAGEWQAEALETPQSLDRTHEDRPFGVAGQNRRLVKKALANGMVVELERQELAVGFPSQHTYESLASTGCGHIMHEHCFEVYLGAVRRRHGQQIARHHPENLAKGEFLCPLCKALGNAFLPIIWKPKTLRYPGPLASDVSFEEHCRNAMEEPPRATNGGGPHLYYKTYGETELISPLSVAVEPAFVEACNPSAPPAPPVSQPTSPTYHFRIRDEDDSIVMGFNIIGGEEFVSAASITRQLAPQGQLGATGEINFKEVQKVYTYMASPYGISQWQLAERIAECLASTICSVEIAQRGVGATALLLDSVSSQTLTHLRVLVETALSLRAVNLLTPATPSSNPAQPSSPVAETISRHDNTIRDIWGEMFNLAQAPSHISIGNGAFLRRGTPLPFLQQNAFQSFCIHSLTTMPSYGMDVKSSMKLFYLAEITRVVVWFFKSRQPLWQASQSELHSSFERAPAELMKFVHHLALNRGSPGPSDEDTLYHLVKIYSLQFLRRCIILMHVRYNVDFPQLSSEEAELNRVTGLLQLPTLPELLAEAVTCDAANRILFRWTMPARDTPGFTVQLDHPAIYELVGLPKNFDTLQDVAMRQRCPRTGRPILDPSLCLICGAITCTQSTCCTQEVGGKRLGPCQQHTMECGGNIGLFLNVRKCSVVYLHHESGSWTVAPYLDRYGEVDQSLRSNLQLFLSQRRYDAVYRAAWLNHQVSSIIARKLEGEMNTGGWETL